MKNTKPYISVIIPTYNRAAYIAGAIESVLGQKDCKWPFEVIVVDDGSTDDTEQVLSRFKDKITYFKIPHSGKPAVARNAAIAKAGGKFIAFLDSDDHWVENKLANQMPLFEDENMVLVFGNGLIMQANGTLTKNKVLPDEKLKKAEKFESLMKENTITTTTVIVRRSAIDEVGGFSEDDDLRAVEDYELWLRIASRYPKGIKSLAKILVQYRQHPLNISRADDVLALQRIMAVYDKLWLADLTAKNRELLEEHITTTHSNMGGLFDSKSPQDRPVISVVMGIYKDEKHVKLAVQSVLDQTYTNFEFIIINDGSLDRSPEIVKSFNDPRIRLINQTWHGLVYALNQGIKLARGEFIARQDADDISLPSRFEKELAWITQDERRGLVGSFFTYIHERTSSPTSITITTPTKHKDLVQHLTYVNPFAHGSILARKQAMVDAGPYCDEYIHIEDFDLWRRLASTWEIGQIPEVLYWYRISSGSISHQNQETQHKGAAKIVKEIWAKPVLVKSFKEIVKDAHYYRQLNSPFRDQVYDQYLNQQVRMAFSFLVHGRLKSGYRTAVGALWLRPKAIKNLWKTLLWAPIKYLKERSR